LRAATKKKFARRKKKKKTGIVGPNSAWSGGGPDGYPRGNGAGGQDGTGALACRSVESAAYRNDVDDGLQKTTEKVVKLYLSKRRFHLHEKV